MLESHVATDHSVEHQQSKTRWFGGVFLAFVLFLIGLTLYNTVEWMWDDKRLPLSKIILKGDLDYVTAQDVQRAFGRIDHIGTFMSQDISVLQQQVESVPWVANASVRKQWPDTVKVFITEHEPVAIWNGMALLNQQGQVFDGDLGQLHQEQVKLYGPVGTGIEVLTTYRDIEAQFATFDLNISSLVLNERRAWQIILESGIRLELGKESLSERIERFLLLYNKLGADAERVSYIDLRYDTGAAVGWFPEEELQREKKND